MRNENRRYAWLAAPLGLLAMASISACSTRGMQYTDDGWHFFVPLVSRVSNLSDSDCRGSFSAQLASTLVDQGETMDDAKAMSRDTLATLSYGLTPRPFYAFSPSDVRYGFLVQNTKSGCVLRLYERQRKLFGKGQLTYTNDLAYIATHRITGCSCTENKFPPEED
jgi:hypothetical protein